MPTIYETTPPPFGHRMKEFFMMDPELVNLNNGAHGCTPKVVFDRATKLAEESEWNTDYFHYVTYLPLLGSVRENLAKLIGAKTNECVLVPNASMGMNTILRNIDWEEGDTIILTTTTYSSVSLTAVNLNDAPPHPKLSVFKLDFPNSGPAEILEGFRKHIQSVPKVPNKKRVALLDTITSLPGCALPWKEMVKICKEEGVFSAVDAAHSIGHELNINLTEIGPDFWVSNCHKWLMSKRSVAVMYVPERNQHIVRCSIPTSDKYVSPQNRANPSDSFVKQYDWTSTIDLAPYLSVDEALRFRAWIGGEEKINEYCHNLAIEGGKCLAQVLGTNVLDSDGIYTLNMVNVELPFDLKPTPEIDMAFKRKLLGEKKAYSTHCFHNGRWWARASAQVWNEIEDFEKLGKAWLEVIEEVKTEFKDAEKVPACEF